jgi:hypothetical protein
MIGWMRLENLKISFERLVTKYSVVRSADIRKNFSWVLDRMRFAPHKAVTR